MSKPTVYLCGTITPDPKHLRWRETAEQVLARVGIIAVNPIRGKNPSDWTKDGMNAIQPTIYDRGGFVDRDERDVKRADAILLNFPEPLERQSLGTWIEFGWANMLGIPIVVVSTLPEIVEHPFIWKKAARVCNSLTEGLVYLQFLLEPGAYEDLEVPYTPPPIIIRGPQNG